MTLYPGHIFISVFTPAQMSFLELRMSQKQLALTGFLRVPGTVRWTGCVRAHSQDSWNPLGQAFCGSLCQERKRKQDVAGRLGSPAGTRTPAIWLLGLLSASLKVGHALRASPFLCVRGVHAPIDWRVPGRGMDGVEVWGEGREPRNLHTEQRNQQQQSLP